MTCSRLQNQWNNRAQPGIQDWLQSPRSPACCLRDSHGTLSPNDHFFTRLPNPLSAPETWHPILFVFWLFSFRDTMNSEGILCAPVQQNSQLTHEKKSWCTLPSSQGLALQHKTEHATTSISMQFYPELWLKCDSPCRSPPQLNLTCTLTSKLMSDPPLLSSLADDREEYGEGGVIQYLTVNATNVQFVCCFVQLVTWGEMCSPKVQKLY